MTEMHLTNMNNHVIVMTWTGQRIESNMRAIVQQCPAVQKRWGQIASRRLRLLGQLRK